MKNKTKYLVVGVIVVILISVFVVGTNLLKSKPKEEKEKTISQEETRSMLSYTLDGEKTDIKPTKESGYIANKIICENGSNLIWDNTNWEVEIISLESNDVCSVDFTKDVNTNGYRVIATTNVEESIDSLSKATIENGTIIFYPNKGQEIIGVSGCLNGKLENNKVIVSNVTSNQTCNISVQLSIKNLYTLLSDGSKYKLGERGTFDTPFGGTTIIQGYNQTDTIYKEEDNYYFAGNPSDNWVKFAGFWWRIIRTNSTKGTRLLYAGTNHDSIEGYINGTFFKWNSSQDRYYYVQWKYASFKELLENWYTSNILEEYNILVNSIQYCNDTSYIDFPSYEENGRKYGAQIRLIDNKAPSNLCEKNSFGAAAKVGLMTADEVAFIGGVSGYNSVNTYYYRNSVESGCTGSREDPCSATGLRSWWTLSPSAFGYGAASVFYVYGSSGSHPGQLAGNSLVNSCTVRPVITLKPDVLVSGSGTTNDPYVPSL